MFKLIEKPSLDTCWPQSECVGHQLRAAPDGFIYLVPNFVHDKFSVFRWNPWLQIWNQIWVAADEIGSGNFHECRLEVLDNDTLLTFRRMLFGSDYEIIKHHIPTETTSASPRLPTSVHNVWPDLQSVLLTKESGQQSLYFAVGNPITTLQLLDLNPECQISAAPGLEPSTQR